MGTYRADGDMGGEIKKWDGKRQKRRNVFERERGMKAAVEVEVAVEAAVDVKSGLWWNGRGSIGARAGAGVGSGVGEGWGGGGGVIKHLCETWRIKTD